MKAVDHAASVLHLFEEVYPDDKRPRLAIEAARKKGAVTLLATPQEFDARNAYDMAQKAAWDCAPGSGRVAFQAAAWAARSAWACSYSDPGYAKDAARRARAVFP
ncbi:MAG: hypothetical protein KAI73_10475 [Rhodospirillaceae bacterium]|nr:hypothetical protein [Rhodospirillaceae bacterium]